MAKRKLGLTAKKRQAMLEGTDVELNSYKYLWSALTPGTHPTAASTAPVSVVNKEDCNEDLKTKLEQQLIQKFDIAVKDVRKIGIKAMAAYPDGDLAKLADYAESLLKQEAEVRAE